MLCADRGGAGAEAGNGAEAVADDGWEYECFLGREKSL